MHLGVTNESVHVNDIEGHLACELCAEHHHACNPEEEDVVARLKARTPKVLLGFRV
jgi:hypothetical protein